jgi:hypothetical protein
MRPGSPRRSISRALAGGQPLGPRRVRVNILRFSLWNCILDFMFFFGKLRSGIRGKDLNFFVENETLLMIT